MAENINLMAQESKPTEPMRIEYQYAKLTYRVLANLLDFIIFIVIFLCLFAGVRGIVQSTQDYKRIDAEMHNMMISSGLYVKVDNQYKSILTYIDNQTSWDGKKKVNTCIDTIDTFSEYLRLEAGDTIQAKFLKEYDDDRLLEKFNDGKGHPYFVRHEITGEVVFNVDENGDKYVSDLKYYENFYSPFIEEKCLGYFTTYVRAYNKDLKALSIYLFAIEIPISYVIAGILVYWAPTLIFRRGRKTIGKLAYRIGLIDKNLMSPSFARSAARSAIVIFGEFVLSLVTFGIPFIISFTMMLATKKKQGFPDYMLGLIEIDTYNNKIYLNKNDAKMALIDYQKKSIDFRPKDRY